MWKDLTLHCNCIYILAGSGNQKEDKSQNFMEKNWLFHAEQSSATFIQHIKDHPLLNKLVKTLSNLENLWQVFSLSSLRYFLSYYSRVIIYGIAQEEKLHKSDFPCSSSQHITVTPWPDPVYCPGSDHLTTVACVQGALITHIPPC